MPTVEAAPGFLQARHPRRILPPGSAGRLLAPPPPGGRCAAVRCRPVHRLGRVVVLQVAVGGHALRPLAGPGSDLRQQTRTGDAAASVWQMLASQHQSRTASSRVQTKCDQLRCSRASPHAVARFTSRLPLSWQQIHSVDSLKQISNYVVAGSKCLHDRQQECELQT